MAHCFEILLFDVIERSAIEIKVSHYLTPNDYINNFLDDFLEPFGRNSTELFFGLNNTFEKIGNWPWAIIFLDREYKLAGHVCTVRNNRLEVAFSGYSLKFNYSIENSGPPCVSMLFIKDKFILGDLAQKSHLFSECLKLLEDKSIMANWLCIMDPLDSSWVDELERNDAELFMRNYKKQNP